MLTDATNPPEGNRPPDGAETATRRELAALLEEVRALRAAVAAEAPALLDEWGAAHPGAATPTLINLAHYLTLRRRDLTCLQLRLAAFGLSSLGRSEAKTLAALDALIATLTRLNGGGDAPYPAGEAMRAGEEALRAACAAIFGPPPPQAPRSRIMATLPTEAADDPALIESLLRAGMDCARINCAHDDEARWAAMIAHIRRAEAQTGRSCRVLMDVAGPKCRIETLRAPEKLRLQRGDRFTLAATLDAAPPDAVAITPNFPQVIGQLDLGAEVWVNDGKIGARVVALAPTAAELEIFSARPKGERLKIEKGLNFPTIDLDLAPLAQKDFRDLDFIARHADLIGFSFVQRPEDVVLLQDHLAARRGDLPPLPIVLKIETPLAVRNLPRLIAASAALNPTAVMIARGDLAVELGFSRLSEMQEEIVWLCQAAHAPVVWATQVLDRYVSDGAPSRAETTDAAMAQRADCVMLNKGPYLAEGVAFLRDVLLRMDRHHAKGFARYSQLGAWG